MTLQEIVDDAPEYPMGRGSKRAMFSTDCCWWTTRYEHAAWRAGHKHCPHCGAHMRSVDLDVFLVACADRAAPNGPGDQSLLAAAHAANATTCHLEWDTYWTDTIVHDAELGT